jgi:hypothetical protein
MTQQSSIRKLNDNEGQDDLKLMSDGNCVTAGETSRRLKTNAKDGKGEQQLDVTC